MSTPARKLNIFMGVEHKCPVLRKKTFENAYRLHGYLGQLLIQEKEGDFLKIMAGLLLGLKGQS
jgi:hypothetical protein